MGNNSPFLSQIMGNNHPFLSQIMGNNHPFLLQIMGNRKFSATVLAHCILLCKRF